MSEISSNQKEVTTITGNRGKSWDQVEDRELCKSWLEASFETVSDSGQFWQDITEHFNKKFEKTRKPNEKERSRNGLVCRWNHIHPRVNIFCTSLEKAKQLCRTENEDFDVSLKAKELYTSALKKEKGTEEIFKLYHCYQELNGNDRWNKHMELKNKSKDKSTNTLLETTPPATPLANDQQETTPSKSTITTTHHSTNPLSVQNLMEEEEEDDDDEQDMLLDDSGILIPMPGTHKRKLDFYDKYLENQEKKLKILQDRNDSRVMMVDPYSFSDPRKRKYFLFKQAKAFRRVEEEFGDEFRKMETCCCSRKTMSESAMHCANISD